MAVTDFQRDGKEQLSRLYAAWTPRPSVQGSIYRESVCCFFSSMNHTFEHTTHSGVQHEYDQNPRCGCLGSW